MVGKNGEDLENPFPFLIEEFMQAMNDIGKYGFEKYGKDSFQSRVQIGDNSRYMNRVEAAVILAHAKEHIDSYLLKIPHDHFGDLKHQLAAVAFNAMMEFHFGKSEKP